MLPYLIAGAIGFAVAKIFESDDDAPKYADGGEVKSKDDVNVPLYHGTIKEIWKNSEYQSYLYVTYDFEFAKNQALDRAIGEDGTPIVVKIDPNKIKKYIWEVDDDMGIYRDLHTWQDSYNIIGSFVIIGEFDIDNFQIIDIDRLEEDETPKYADGGSVLLAPNGKPSNLTPEQYKLVRTKAFISWFGDWENSPETASKVIDENGEPLVVYHASNNDFNIFDEKYIGSANDRGFYGKGFYFTDNLISVKQYGNIIKSYFLKVTNPVFTYDSPREFSKSIWIQKGDKNLIGQGLEPYESNEWNFYLDDNFSEKVTKNIITNGRNGLIAENVGEYLVYESNQIKLADGSNTTFDGNNPDIRYAGGGKIPNVNHKNIQGKQFTYDGAKFLIVDFPNKSGAWNKGATWRKTAKHHSYIIKLDDIKTNLDKSLFYEFNKPYYIYDDYWLQFNGNLCRSIEGTSTKLIDTLNYEIYEREKREKNPNINNNRGGVR